MEELWMDYSPAAAHRGRAAYIQDYLAAPHESPPLPPPPPPPPHTALTLEFTYLGHAGSNSLLHMPFSLADTKNSQRRMIQHRASAARSRARKHAYTKELELELEQLRRDNRMLIKRQQELHARLALPAQDLQRCRSAPAP